MMSKEQALNALKKAVNVYVFVALNKDDGRYFRVKKAEAQYQIYDWAIDLQQAYENGGDLYLN